MCVHGAVQCGKTRASHWREASPSPGSWIRHRRDRTLGLTTEEAIGIPRLVGKRIHCGSPWVPSLALERRHAAAVCLGEPGVQVLFIVALRLHLRLAASQRLKPLPTSSLLTLLHVRPSHQPQ
jgi:hypothetical protein